MRVTALVSHVKISPFDGFRSTFSGNLLLLGDTQPRAVRGELTFDRALYDRDFSIDLASLLQRKRVATVGSNPTFFDPVTLDVRLVAPPESIEVRTNVARQGLGELFARHGAIDPVRGDSRGGGGASRSGPALRPDVRPDLGSAVLRDGSAGDSKYRVTFGITGTAARLSTRFVHPRLRRRCLALATGIAVDVRRRRPIGPAPTSSKSVQGGPRLREPRLDAVTSRTKVLPPDRFQIDPASNGSTFGARGSPWQVVGRTSTRPSVRASSNQQQIITLGYQLFAATAFLRRGWTRTALFARAALPAGSVRPPRAAASLSSSCWRRGGRRRSVRGARSDVL